MLTACQVQEILRQTNALLDGHFLLRSGLHSPHYVQCALVLQWPAHAERLAAALAGRLGAWPATVVVSPALGGLLVGHEVGRALGLRHIFAEKDPSGALQLRRNFALQPDDRAIVCEDVITRGGRVRETIELIRQRGSRVVAVAALVDRSGGDADFGVPLVSLLAMKIETFEPTACPLCHKGVPLIKPGS